MLILYRFEYTAHLTTTSEVPTATTEAPATIAKAPTTIAEAQTTTIGIHFPFIKYINNWTLADQHCMFFFVFTKTLGELFWDSSFV